MACQTINLIKLVKEYQMAKKKKVAMDISKDMLAENATQEAKGAESDPQDQDQQKLPEPQRPYKPLNDLGNAERFVEQNGERVRYCPELDCWFVYVEGRWVQDTGKRIYLMAKDTVKKIPQEAQRDNLSAKDKEDILAHANKSSSKGRIKAIPDLAKWEDGITVNVNQLDADPWLLNCKNGILNLKTKELLPHDAANLSTKMVQVPYEPEAGCPEWDGFIGKIMNAAVSANAFSFRLSSRSNWWIRWRSAFFSVFKRRALSRSQSLAISHAFRHCKSCSGYIPFFRQYSARSVSLKAAVSKTAANLSRADQPSGPLSPSGSRKPFSRACLRHLKRVASEIPSSWANCLMDRLCGGIIFRNTASLRSGEYRMSVPPTPSYSGF
jgi:hypothetical protein